MPKGAVSKMSVIQGDNGLSGFRSDSFPVEQLAFSCEEELAVAWSEVLLHSATLKIGLL